MYIDYLLSVLVYVLIGIELLINNPMNQIYSIPLNKNNLIIFGLLVSLLLGIVLTEYVPIPIVGSIIALIIFVIHGIQLRHNVDRQARILRENMKLL